MEIGWPLRDLVSVRGRVVDASSRAEGSENVCVELEREVQRRAGGWRSRGLVMPIIARGFDLWILQLAVAVDLRLTGLDTFLIIEKLERLGK